MEYKKKDIDEIIDGNGELIGNDAIPSVDANADTQAKHTSDYNAKVGTQPFRYDMLGRFGFTLMPFMEGEDKEKIFSSAEFMGHPLTKELAEFLYDKNKETLKRYYKNPKAMQNEYRQISPLEFDDDESNQTQFRMAADILEILKPHLDDSLKQLDEQFKENLVEGNVVEDKMVKKKEDEMSTRSDVGDVREKKIEKIAGLINKLEKQDIDKLINLLEKKNG